MKRTLQLQLLLKALLRTEHFFQWKLCLCSSLSACTLLNLQNTQQIGTLGFGLQLLPLFNWNSSPSLWAKNPEMGHIWLVPTPRFERSHAIKLFMRHPILDIICIVYKLILKLCWQIFILHYASCRLLQWFVLSLSNTILLWCVRDRILDMNTCIFTILNEIILDIITNIFRFEDLEFPPRLVFNQGCKDFEKVKDFRLIL